MSVNSEFAFKARSVLPYGTCYIKVWLDYEKTSAEREPNEGQVHEKVHHQRTCAIEFSTQERCAVIYKEHVSRAERDWLPVRLRE
jgi:hypothetical protein